MDTSPVWCSGELATENSTRPTGGLKRGSPLLKPWSDHPLYHRCEPFNHSRKKMTIDLQIAIIEKIKKIKQKKIENVLTYHLTLRFVVAFCLNLKKMLKDAALEVSNICSRLLIVLLPQSWFPMRLNFFPFSFILFVVPSLFFPLLKTLKAFSSVKQHKLSCHLAQLWCFGR